MSRDYTKLKSWQLAHKLVLKVYKATSCFPKSELFGLISQTRRAAISVAANTVEGAGRKTEKEFLQFLNMAMSSLAEVGYYILLSNELMYLETNEHKELTELHQETAKVLQGLITRVNKDLKLKANS